MQSQEMICGGRYLSGDQPMRVFAAGNLTSEMKIEVTWRSGRRTVVDHVKGNRIYEVDEPQATKDQSPNSRAQNSQPAPLFGDVSALIARGATN